MSWIQLGVSPDLTQGLGSYAVSPVIPIPAPVVAPLTVSGQYAGILESPLHVDLTARISALNFDLHTTVTSAGRRHYYVTTRGATGWTSILDLDPICTPHTFWRLPQGKPLTLQLVLSGESVHDNTFNRDSWRM